MTNRLSAIQQRQGAIWRVFINHTFVLFAPFVVREEPSFTTKGTESGPSKNASGRYFTSFCGADLMGTLIFCTALMMAIVCLAAACRARSPSSTFWLVGSPTPP